MKRIVDFDLRGGRRSSYILQQLLIQFAKTRLPTCEMYKTRGDASLLQQHRKLLMLAEISRQYRISYRGEISGPHIIIF